MVIHTKNVCDSFSKKVAVLKRIKFLPKTVLQIIYHRAILPFVLYGIVVSAARVFNLCWMISTAFI